MKVDDKKPPFNIYKILTKEIMIFFMLIYIFADLNMEVHILNFYYLN